MGGIVKSIGKAIKKVFKGIAKFVKKYIKQIIIAVVVVAAIYFTAGAAAPALLGPSTGAGVAGGAGVMAAPAIGGATQAAGTGIFAAESAALAGGSTVGAVQGGIAPIATGASEGVGVIGGAQGALTPITSVSADGAIGLGTSTAAAGAEAAQAVTMAQQLAPAAQEAATALEVGKSLSNGVANSPSGAPVSTLAKNTVTEVTSNPMVPEVIKAKGESSVFGSIKEGFGKITSGASNFAEKHPYMTYGLLQTAGAMMKPDPNAAKERQVALQAGGASPSGQIWNGSEMVDFKNSPQASARFKREAGVLPATPIEPIVPVAPVEITTTPLAELPAPAGLINPPAPATISMANAELANKGLLGNVKITGT